MGLEIRCLEDLLIFSKWFRSVLEEHFTLSGEMLKHERLKVRTHEVILSALETDVIVEGQGKSLAIELKREDLWKAVLQAVRRRPFFDYFYIALDLKTSTILSILRNHPVIFQHGIGVVSTEDNAVIVRSYIRKSESERYLGLLKNKQADFLKLKVYTVKEKGKYVRRFVKLPSDFPEVQEVYLTWIPITDNQR